MENELGWIEKSIYWLFWKIHKFCKVDEFKNKSFKEFLEDE